MWHLMYQHTHIHANQHLGHISPAEKGNINTLMSALITVWIQPDPSAAYILLTQVLKEIIAEHTFDGIPGHELPKLGALQAFVAIAAHQGIPTSDLTNVLQLPKYREPPLPHNDVKILFKRLLTIIDMYNKDLTTFSEEQRIQFATQVFNFSPLCIYTYETYSLLQSNEHPITLRFIQPNSHEKKRFNDRFYGLKHNYWSLQQGIIAHPNAIDQLMLWLREHQSRIPTFLQRMKTGTLTSTYVDWNIGTPDLIQELLVSAWCQSHTHLYLQWHAQENPWLLEILCHLYQYKDTLQAHAHGMDWSQETLARNTMFFSPNFATSMQTFEWSKPYKDTFATQSDGSCSLKSRSFVLTEKGRSLFQTSQAGTVSADAQAICM